MMIFPIKKMDSTNATYLMFSCAVALMGLRIRLGV